MDQCIYKNLQTIPELKLEDKFMNFEWYSNNQYMYGIIIGKNKLKISSIKSDEIRKYYINKYITECLTYDEKIKLDDLNTNNLNTNDLKINKEKQTVLINNFTMNIKNIKSNEIRNYLISNINFNEKETTQYLFNLIVHPHNKPQEYEMYIQVNFDTNMFNSLQNKNQLYLLKYIFSIPHLINKIKNFLEIFTIFSKNKNNLLELINIVIKMNDQTNLDYILRNKTIKLNEEDYKPLHDIVLNLRLFDMIKVLTKYEARDYILNND